jgi:serine/threonine protein kinase/formylglycine-generating enzyme required for sulfatase activity
MSSAADPTATFLAAIHASQLLTPAQFEEVAGWATKTRADVTALAKEINRRGWLTAYQIKEIFKGRGRDLVVDRYILLDLIGEGGMGRVFKAHDSRLARDVALKIIRKERLSHPAAMARFGQEMMALGKLQHPNVVKAFDASQAGDIHFVVMEYIDGMDLTRMIRERGPLPIPEACEYIRQSALGLHHAYESGLVHRDIKPSNILISRDGRQVKLVDLGLARLQEPGGEAANRVTQEGFVIGTPDFLSPEQARNPGAVDIRADIYALAGTLFYILTGKVPYEGATPTEKLLKHCTDPPPDLRPHRPDAPPALDQLIQVCMAKRAEDRLQTPLDLAVALQPYCPRPAIGSGPISGGYPVAPSGTHAPATAWPPGAYPQPAQPPVDPRFYPAPANYPPGHQPGFPPGGAPPPQPIPAGGRGPNVMPLPPLDPNSSSQVFKLPPQTIDADPIRSRARAKFPYAFVGVACGAVLILIVLVYGAFHTSSGNRPGPVPFTTSVGMKMVLLEGGKFRMGSPTTELGRPVPRPGFPDEEGPVREITITGPFLMCATEITHNHYSRVMGSAPDRSAVVRKAANAADHPVDMISYDDTIEFCRRLTEKDREQPYARPGWAFRLPTEAEWEYACRAGTDTPFAVGAKTRLIFRPQLKQALFTVTEDDPLQDADPIEPSPIPGKVAQFPPNAWGLYDMHGNVAEWCQDWYKSGYSSDGPLENPPGPPTGDRRVVRGGSFKDPASACRSASRIGYRPGERRDTVGFRVVYAPGAK